MSVVGTSSLGCTCALPTEILLKVFSHLDRRSLLCVGASSHRLRCVVSEHEDHYFVCPLLGPVNNASLFWTRNASFKSRWSDLGAQPRLLRLHFYANPSTAAGDTVDLSSTFDNICTALSTGLVTHMEVKIDVGPMPLRELHRLFMTAAPGLRTLRLTAPHRGCQLSRFTFANSAPLLHRVTVVGGGHFAPRPQSADSQGPNVTIAGVRFVDLQLFNISEIHMLGYLFNGAEHMVVNIAEVMYSWSPGREVWPLSPTLRTLVIDVTDPWCEANCGISGDANMNGKIRDALTHVIAHWQLQASTQITLTGFDDYIPLGATRRAIEILEACSVSQIFSVQIYLPDSNMGTLRIRSYTRSGCELCANLRIAVWGAEKRWSHIISALAALGTRICRLVAPPEFFDYLRVHQRDFTRIIRVVPVLESHLTVGQSSHES